VTNLCLGRATTRSHSSQWSKKNIFRKAPPSVVSGYGKRPINLNKVVANFEKHIFLSQTDLTRTVIISNSYNEMFEAEMTKFKMFREKVNMDFYFVGITF
jgi:hypothetical protein